MKNEYNHGIYNIVNKHKYIGKKNPMYRSSWEYRVFYWCDQSKNILEWSVESIAISYLFEIDNKLHRYYPDVYASIRQNDGNIQKYIIEIKPYKFTCEPKKPLINNKKSQKRYNYEIIQWIKNNNKWKYAIEYCNKHNYIFKILTEKNIF